jgi:hypothetical protein
VARETREIEFSPADTTPVVNEMALLAGAGDGWINLLPGVPEDEQPPPPSLLGSILGAAPSPVTMCTWMPPGHGRKRGVEEVTIGIMHPRGRHAVAQLAEMGIALPEGWRVRQDHARRGLIVLAPQDTAHAQVLDWTLAAGAALALTSLTGSWQARVFLPSARRRSGA